MRVSGTFGAALALLATAALPAAAADKKRERPAIFAKLVDCKAIADDARRLACYDAQVATLDQAEKNNELVVVDRQQVREARRSLFGLTLPSLSIFGSGDKKEEEEFQQIETTIRAASFNESTRRWVVILADGARWVQSDTRRLSYDPKPGQPIKIRQAAMGSYNANINGQIAIKMRREN